LALIKKGLKVKRFITTVFISGGVLPGHEAARQDALHRYSAHEQFLSFAEQLDVTPHQLIDTCTWFSEPGSPVTVIRQIRFWADGKPANDTVESFCPSVELFWLSEKAPPSSDHKSAQIEVA